MLYYFLCASYDIERNSYELTIVKEETWKVGRKYKSNRLIREKNKKT